MSDTAGGSIWRRGDVVDGIYEVRDVITAGGMGLVHRVHHLTWGIDLAVKSPRSEVAAARGGMREFENEARTWVGLGEHPNTVNCVYVRRIAGAPRVFAEWIEGGSLADALADGRLHSGGRRRTLLRLLDIAVQVARGLDHAHRHRLVHQDVKPGNVLLDSVTDTAKVTDFGLARARTAVGNLDVPGTSTVASTYGGMTPAYRSPEQWAAAATVRRETLTRATDTWSWALIVLELFAGRRTWRHGHEGAAALRDLLAAGPTDTRSLPMPPTLHDLVGRCLTTDPAGRPRDMAEIADTVAAVYGQAAGAVYPRRAALVSPRLADELSNQALSMLDLDRPTDADVLWERAAAADPRNPHVVYNRGLRRWRTGLSTDAALSDQMDSLCAARPDDAVAYHLCGLVHLERADRAAASAALARAGEFAPEDPAIRAARQRAACLDGTDPMVLAHSTPSSEHAPAVRTLAASRDGRRAVTTDAAGYLRIWDVVDGRVEREFFIGLGGSELEVANPHYVVVDDSVRTALVRASGGGISVWDLDSGTRMHTLVRRDEDAQGWPQRPALSGDGTIALTVDHGTVRVWDARTGECLDVRRDGPTGRGFHGALALSADGRVAVAAGRNARDDPSFSEVGDGLEVWNPRTGQVSWRADGVLRSAALSADGRVLLTEDSAPEPLRRGTLRIRDARTGEEIRELRTPDPFPLTTYSLARDGRRMLCHSWRAVELWDLDPPRCIRMWRRRAEISASAPYGDHVLLGGTDGTIKLHPADAPGPTAPWSYARSRPGESRLRDETGVREALRRTTDLMTRGRARAAASEIRSARARPGFEHHPDLLDRWQEITIHARRRHLVEVWARDVPQTAASEFLGPALDGRALLITAGGRLEVRSATDGSRIHDLGPLDHDDVRPADYTLSDDGCVLLMNVAGTVQVWDLRSGRSLGPLTGAALPLAIDEKGRMAITGHDGTSEVMVWDLVTGGHRSLPGRHSYGLHDAQLGAGRSRALVADTLGEIRLWDLDRGRCLRTVAPFRWIPDDELSSTAVGWFQLSRNGRAVVAAMRGGEVEGWNAVTGRTTRTLRTSGDDVERLAVAPDGRRAVIVGRDRTLAHWNFGTGRCRSTARTSDGWGVVAISPDSRFTAVASGSEQLQIYDTATGRLRRTVPGAAGRLLRLGIVGGGRFVVALEDQSHARIWELDWEFTVPRRIGGVDVEY